MIHMDLQESLGCDMSCGLQIDKKSTQYRDQNIDKLGPIAFMVTCFSTWSETLLGTPLEPGKSGKSGLQRGMDTTEITTSSE